MKKLLINKLNTENISFKELKEIVLTLDKLVLKCKIRRNLK